MRRDTGLRPGTRLGSYILGEPIGQGGYATVYLAQGPDGHTVALKAMRTDGSAATRRFLREFESLRLLRVPGAVRVYDAVVEGDLLWFTMDRVFGRPFHEALHDEGYVPDRVERTIEVGQRLMHTLAGLHASGFAHRDIKPSNVLVDAGGTPHVLDFGISSWFADENTSTDLVLGTVPYMAPEQLAGLPIGPPADVYSAGLLLHESIAGLPTPPAHQLGWVSRTCLERRPPLATRFREVPLALSKLVERMTSVDPEDRPTAAEAEVALQAMRDGARGTEWPDPPFVDPGPWMGPAEAVLGDSGPRVCVIEGARGTGRSRVVEQVRRIGLLEGTWSYRVRCRADRVGAPWEELFTRLCGTLRDDQLAEIAGDDFDAVSALWPHLPLPRSAEGATTRQLRGLVDAIAAMVRRLGRRRRLLLAIEALEEVDPFTAEVLRALAPNGPSLLLVHESRWATALSRRLVQDLVDGGARLTTSRPPADPSAIATGVCPADPIRVASATTALAAAEQGWRALARWRGERFRPPDAAASALAAHDGSVPAAVARAVGGRALERSPWVVRDGLGIRLAGETARVLAAADLGDRSRAARQLADAWEAALGHRAEPGVLARLRLIGGDPRAAWRHAVQAAIGCDRLGMHAEARAWALLTESLSSGDGPDPALVFELALVKARIALRTEVGELRTSLIETAEALSRGERDRMRVRALEAAYALRQGGVRKALASALHVAAQENRGPEVAAETLLVAVEARLTLGDTVGARRELERARGMLATVDDPILAIDLDGWDAELCWHARELGRCEALCENRLRASHALGYVRGVASAMARHAAVLRLRGDRTEAEARARGAFEAFATAGDIQLDVQARLALATLEAERGDLVDARNRLDAALRHIRGAHLDRLIPAAMRLALRIAAARGDVSDADVALAVLEAEGVDDDEAPAARVRWWRARGDLDRALRVPRPAIPGFGRGLWHMERARTLLAGSRPDEAIAEAEWALVIAGTGGFADLMLYARLLVEGLRDLPERRWRDLQQRAAASPWVDLALAALEIEARRSHDQPQAARRAWRTLAARSRELGHRSDADDAEAWLGALE